MKLLILDGPRDPRTADYTHYRGTYRANPTFCDSASEQDEINVLFSWFLEEGGELGVVHDLHRSLRFAELCNQHLTSKSCFEVVEVTDCDEAPQGGGDFLGYDLSAGYNYSLLSSQLQMPLTGMDPHQAIRELCELLTRHFAPQLNNKGLFQSAETASHCLRVMRALQNLSPNLFESGDLTNFHVVAVYTVSGKRGRV